MITKIFKKQKITAQQELMIFMLIRINSKIYINRINNFLEILTTTPKKLSRCISISTKPNVNFIRKF